MLRFSANLSFLYQEHPFLERFAAAARDGFRGVEYPGPYETPKHEVAEALDANGLTQVLFNLPPGNWADGERGIACLPERVEEFRDGVALALDYAAALGCRRLNVLAGIAPEGADHATLEDTFVANLQHAAPLCRKAGIALLIEPINLRDMPGFFMSTTHHAEQVLRRVGDDNLFIQYDIYHQQVMRGDLVPTFERLGDRIGHVQIADSPGRNEPGTGEINYGFVLEAIRAHGYDGWVGCEYKPLTTTTEGLGWMSAWTGARPAGGT